MFGVWKLSRASICDWENLHIVILRPWAYFVCKATVQSILKSIYVVKEPWKPKCIVPAVKVSGCNRWWAVNINVPGNKHFKCLYKVSAWKTAVWIKLNIDSAVSLFSYYFFEFLGCYVTGRASGKWIAHSESNRVSWRCLSVWTGIAASGQNKRCG